MLSASIRKHFLILMGCVRYKQNTVLQTITSTTEDMMETLDGTEMKFNDTDQRVNRKILNIFRATKDPNFLMKSFQSNGSFQQVLASEGKGRHK